MVIFAIEIAAAVWGYTHKDEVGVSPKNAWVLQRFEVLS